MGNLLIIARPKEENEGLGLDSPIDPSIWRFVELLSEKLDEALVPNLFGNQNKPASNLLVDMLQCHKLRSTYDFETAIERKWDLMNKVQLKDSRTVTGESYFRWNFRVLDLAAGDGTTVDTIIALKETGVFRGAKRKLRFDVPKKESKPSKCGRMDELNTLMGSLDVTGDTLSGKKNQIKQCKREDVKLIISGSRVGWHGGKKTSPKQKQPPRRSPENKNPRFRSDNSPMGAEGTTSDAPRTPRAYSGRKKKGKTETPAIGQSLISSFIRRTPRGKKGGLARDGNREKSWE